MKMLIRRNPTFRILCCVAAFMPVLVAAGCGSNNNNNNTANGLFGDWNIVMYPTGSPNPSYVFALAISEGTNNYSGSPITYTGSVPVPSNQCINSSAIHATATTTSSNFTMTVTDTTTQTVITMTGSLATNGTNVFSGTYTNPASVTCSASNGTFNMTIQ